MYQYNADFYRSINNGAVRSARATIPALTQSLPIHINTVLDVGCGVGAWLSVWKENGCQVTGLDGDYVDRSMLMIDSCEFHARDLARPFQMPARFDIAQSLEVAEHLPASAAAQFVESLCSASDMVLFSAAPPGQGGENHINEKPYTYWKTLFEQRGYRMYDVVRDSILDNPHVMPWYRYNTFLFINKTQLPAVHTSLSQYLIEPGEVPKDKSPKLYQARKRLIKLIPTQYSTQIAVLKKKILTRKFRSNERPDV